MKCELRIQRKCQLSCSSLLETSCSKSSLNAEGPVQRSKHSQTHRHERSRLLRHHSDLFRARAATLTRQSTYRCTICSAHRRRSRQARFLLNNFQSFAQKEHGAALQQRLFLDSRDQNSTASKQTLEETFRFLLITSLPDALTPFIHSFYAYEDI